MDAKKIINNIKNETDINNLFVNIKELVISRKNKVYSTINTEMFNLYWNIGKIIMRIQQSEGRTNYGSLDKLSKKLTNKFERGFSARNLRTIRKSYSTFPI